MDNGNDKSKTQWTLQLFWSGRKLCKPERILLSLKEDTRQENERNSIAAPRQKQKRPAPLSIYGKNIIINKNQHSIHRMR